MTKLSTNFTCAGLLSAGLLIAGSSAYGDDWIGGTDSEFSTLANWNTAATALDSNFTANISGEFTVNHSSITTVDRTFINGGAVLNITGGSLDSAKANSTRRDFLGRGSAGTINQSGGTYAVGHMLSIGGGGANGNGIYNLTGGTLSIYRGANSIIDDSNPYGRPSLDVSDEENAGSGLLQISGGNMITRFGAHIGTTGTFSVLGSGASSINIGNNSNGNGWWSQEAGSTLKAAVDAGGLTKIFIDEQAGQTAVAEFKAGSLLDVSFLGEDVTGTWTVLELENQDITNVGSGIAFAEGVDTSIWSFAIDNTGTNGLLTVTAVPEPSAFALLAGLLALASIATKRRK